MADTTAPVGSESNPGAPTPRKAKGSASAEPKFSDGGSMGADDTMSVNPTPKSATEPYTPDPYGGKGGPQALPHEDLARKGGGPEQRVDDRQAALVKKMREDKSVSKLLRDESRRGFGGMADVVEAATEETTTEATDDKPTEEKKPRRTKADIDEIARLQREKREFQDKLKAANGERTEAARTRKLQALAADYPIAAAAALLGMEPEKFTELVYQDDVAKKSAGAGDKIKIDPAALAKDLEEADKRAAGNSELDRERAVAAELRQQLAARDAMGNIERIVRGDSKRWELCNRDPEVASKVLTVVRKQIQESGWKPSNEEAVAFTESLLDDMEKENEAIGKRFTRAAATSTKKERPAPPPGQRQAQKSYSDNIDRYGRAPKKESVEDRQDKLIAKYRGVSMTGDS
jgi:hypothetical protein